MPDGGFDLESMLQAAGNGKLSAPQPSFPMVPAHPSGESGFMPQTNLSPEDLAKFNAGQKAGPAAVPSQPQPSPPPQQPFDVEGALAQAGAGKLPVPSSTPEPTTSSSEASQPSLLSQIAGSMAATVNAHTARRDWQRYGLPERCHSSAVADDGSSNRSQEVRWDSDFQGPLTAFNEGLANEQAQSQALQKRYPIASTGGELMSGAATGAMMAPMLGYTAPAAAGILPKIGAAADYLGRNASVGGLMSMLSGGSPTTGAAVGGGLAAALPGVAKVAALPVAAVRQFAPLWSSGARSQSVQQTLARDLAGSPIASSSVGPLDLAQATGNPTIAAKVRYAQGLPGEPTDQAVALREAQADAARGQVAQIGAPATAPDASSSFVTQLRGARRLAGAEENKLWTDPALADVQVTPDSVQSSVNSAVSSMDPVLQASMPARLRALVNRLNGAKETSVRDLNGIRSDFEKIARTSSDGAERSMARTLSDSFLHGMGSVPEIAGAPARVVPRGWETVNGQTKWTNGYTVPEVTPDPAILAAWQKARDYTRRMRTMFGTPDVSSLLARNEAGVHKVEASEGLRKFFNFSNGSPEGPANIKELTDFVSALRQPGAMQAAQGMKDSVRSFVAKALTDASRLNEGQNFNPKLAQDFLRKNGAWMQTSGLFDQAQLDAARKLFGYAAQLRSTERLTAFSGSATQPKTEVAKTFIDRIMSPWTRRIMEATLPFVGHEAHGGGAGMVMGTLAIPAVEKAFANAEHAMTDLMASALLDSRVARDLMMRPGNEGFLSPQTRQLMDRLRLSLGSTVAPQMLARPSPATVQVGQ